MNRISFFHLKLTSTSLDEVVAYVDKNLKNQRRKILITSVNAAMTVISRNDRLITDSINASDIINIDGMSVYFGLRVLGIKTPERVAGPDVFYNLVRLAAQKGYRPYFLGAKPEIIEMMVHRFRNEFKDLEIAGYHHGYFKDEETDALMLKIDATKADMIFLGITSPKRELFTNKYLTNSIIPIWKGVGGAFDIYADHTKRAPSWLQKIGMEWFYRLCQEPGRMWKRYLTTNTIFIYIILGEFFRKLLTGNAKVFWEKDQV